MEARISPQSKTPQATVYQTGPERNVYCVRCLRELFYLSKEDKKNLIGAGSGRCPRCEGQGRLFMK